jgi:hypothetical protein
MKSADKLKGTPCADLKKDYHECLSNLKRNGGRVGCRPVATALEECAAKYIGKLD